MTKELWMNLPVKNVQKSKEFFTKLGFSFDTKYGNTDRSAGLVIGEKKTVIMLFQEQAFKSFTNAQIADVNSSAEVLFSISAESKEEVDEMAEKAVAAGGQSKHQPIEMQGWMYGCLFTDLDGHRWNILYMDIEKMPK